MEESGTFSAVAAIMLMVGIVATLVPTYLATRVDPSVEKGALAIAFGEVRYEIGAGASALAHTDRPHAYACVGRQPVRFIMVVAEWHSRKR